MAIAKTKCYYNVTQPEEVTTIPLPFLCDHGEAHKTKLQKMCPVANWANLTFSGAASMPFEDGSLSMIITFCLEAECAC